MSERLVDQFPLFPEVYMNSTDKLTVDRQIEIAVRNEDERITELAKRSVDELPTGIDESGQEDDLDSAATTFLNNFHANLAGGMTRVQIKNYHLEEHMIAEGETAAMTKRDGVTLCFSDRARTTTFREFYAEIDQLTDEAGIDPYVVAALVKRSNQHEGSTDPAMAKRALRNYLLPVYREMRMRGYSHGDLTR